MSKIPKLPKGQSRPASPEPSPKSLNDNNTPNMQVLQQRSSSLSRSSSLRRSFIRPPKAKGICPSASPPQKSGSPPPAAAGSSLTKGLPPRIGLPPRGIPSATAIPASSLPPSGLPTPGGVSKGDSPNTKLLSPNPHDSDSKLSSPRKSSFSRNSPLRTSRIPRKGSIPSQPNTSTEPAQEKAESVSSDQSDDRTGNFSSPNDSRNSSPTPSNISKIPTVRGSAIPAPSRHSEILKSRRLKYPALWNIGAPNFFSENYDMSGNTSLELLRLGVEELETRVSSLESQMGIQNTELLYNSDDDDSPQVRCYMKRDESVGAGRTPFEAMWRYNYCCLLRDLQFFNSNWCRFLTEEDIEYAFGDDDDLSKVDKENEHSENENDYTNNNVNVTETIIKTCRPSVLNKINSKSNPLSTKDVFAESESSSGYESFEDEEFPVIHRSYDQRRSISSEPELPARNDTYAKVLKGMGMSYLLPVTWRPGAVSPSKQPQLYRGARRPSSLRQIPLQPSLSRQSSNLSKVDEDGFEITKSQWKRVRAQERAIEKSQYKELFIYNVFNSYSADDVYEHLLGMGVEVSDLYQRSHAGARRKSFVLTVHINQLRNVMEGHKWPKGIMIREYIERGRKAKFFK